MKTYSSITLLLLLFEAVHGKQILLVQGQHHLFDVWKHRANLANVDLIYGAFDVGSCDDPLCVSLQGTTWTSGRNQLAKYAYYREINSRQTYEHWTFADADVILKCITKGSTNDKDFQPVDECFALYFQFVHTANQPVAVVFHFGSHWYSDAIENVKEKAIVNIASYDAIFNTFRRNVVHLFLPYSTDLDSNSWWSSQAISWHFLQCLAPRMATAPAFIFYDNPGHLPYPRNQRDLALERAVAVTRLNGVVLPEPPRDQEIGWGVEAIEDTASLDHEWFIHTEKFRSCSDAMRSFSDLFFAG